jgi:hypothetical protein
MPIHVKSTLGLAVVALLIGLSSVPTFADQSKPDDSFVSLKTNLESLVRRFYPKAKIKSTDSSIHFEYKTKQYDITQTNTIEPGPEWGGVLGDVSLSSGPLKDEDAVERKLNQYSYYVVMEMHTNCPSTDNHVDARLGYPFDVQPEFLDKFKTLIRDLNPPKQGAP